MIPHSPTKNLGISRQSAIAVAAVSVSIVVVACIAGLIFIPSERDTTSVFTLLAGLGLSISQLVTALKATEAADTSAKAKSLAELSVSQRADLAQMVAAACPHPDCPFHANGGIK